MKLIFFILPFALYAERPNPDQPAAAMKHYLAKRVPIGQRQLPVERYIQAREKLRRMPVYSSRARRMLATERDGKNKERAISLGQWTPLGPGNVGGRTRVLLIHPTNPKLLYAAGVAGGIWRSTDEGASWTPLNDMLPNLAINTMAMDPNNPNIIYAGTGEGFGNFDAVRGAGIFKTTDGGDNWTWLESTGTAGFYYVNKLVISKTDSQRVYAATLQGVFRSLDGGATWERTLDRRNPGQGCQDLALRTDREEDFLFAACRATPQGAVWRNTHAHVDGKWEEVHTLENMRRTSLALAPSNQDIIYAMSESIIPQNCPADPGPNPSLSCFRNGLLGLYRSTQAGDAKTWETRAKPGDENKINASLLSNPLAYFGDICSGGRKSFSSQGWYDNVLAVDPVNPEILWAGGIDLFRSEDGGANFGIASYWWQRGIAQYSHADHHAIVFHPGYDGDSNQTLYVTNDGGVFRTDNARAETAKGDRAACSASNSKISWRDLNKGYAVTQFHHGSVYPGGHFYVGGTQDNGTNRGTDADGSNAWNRIFSGDGGYTAVNPKDPRILYTETTTLSLQRSTNGSTFRGATFGISEPAANFSFITPYTMDPTDPNRLWIGGRSLWRTTDGALNWQGASTALLTNTFISAIAVSPADPNRVMAGSSDGRIFSQKQALGANRDTEWPFTRPRNGNVTWLAFDPINPDIAYATYSTFSSAATDRHVYKTEDGGVTWTAIDGSGDTAIPDIPAHTILPDPRNPQTLYLGTDLGIFVTLDGGANWAKEDSGFPNTVVESMAIEAQGSGSQLHAFTHGRGAWKVWLGPGAPCTYELSTERIQAPPAGGTFPVQIRTEPGCPWSGLSSATFANIDIPPAGIGPAEIKIIFPASSVRRQATFLLADKVLTMVQGN